MVIITLHFFSNIIRTTDDHHLIIPSRILKKEPLSYTFVEPDKRVVQSLGRLAQAAEDNGIGSRIIRAEPLEYDFHKLHFSKARRSMVSLKRLGYSCMKFKC